MYTKLNSNSYYRSTYTQLIVKLLCDNNKRFQTFCFKLMYFKFNKLEKKI